MTQDKMTKDTPAPNEMPDEPKLPQVNDVINLLGHSWKVYGIHLGAVGVESLIELESLTHRSGWTGEWESHPRVFVPEVFVRHAMNTPANLRAPVAAGGENKPAVYYCENGKTLEGLEQGALAVLSNLMIKTNAQTAEFMIGNEKDGEFYFTCSRGKQPAAPAVDLEALIRDTALVAQNIDDGSGPHKQDVEWVIRHLAAQGMIKGRG